MPGSIRKSIISWHLCVIYHPEINVKAMKGGMWSCLHSWQRDISQGNISHGKTETHNFSTTYCSSTISYWYIFMTLSPQNLLCFITQIFHICNNKKSTIKQLSASSTLNEKKVFFVVLPNVCIVCGKKITIKILVGKPQLTFHQK